MRPQSLSDIMAPGKRRANAASWRGRGDHGKVSRSDERVARSRLAGVGYRASKERPVLRLQRLCLVSSLAGHSGKW